jgi:hypothetical protein
MVSTTARGDYRVAVEFFATFDDAAAHVPPGAKPVLKAGECGIAYTICDRTVQPDPREVWSSIDQILARTHTNTRPVGRPASWTERYTPPER